MSMTNNHASSIGTCSQSGMTIPSFPSSEVHLGRLTIRNFRAGLFPNGSLRESEKPHSGVAVDQGNRNSQIAG